MVAGRMFLQPGMAAWAAGGGGGLAPVVSCVAPGAFPPEPPPPCPNIPSVFSWLVAVFGRWGGHPTSCSSWHRGRWHSNGRRLDCKGLQQSEVMGDPVGWERLFLWNAIFSQLQSMIGKDYKCGIQQSAPSHLISETMQLPTLIRNGVSAAQRDQICLSMGPTFVGGEGRLNGPQFLLQPWGSILQSGAI